MEWLAGWGHLHLWWSWLGVTLALLTNTLHHIGHWKLLLEGMENVIEKSTYTLLNAINYGLKLLLFLRVSSG